MAMKMGPSPVVITAPVVPVTGGDIGVGLYAWGVLAEAATAAAGCEAGADALAAGRTGVATRGGDAAACTRALQAVALMKARTRNRLRRGRGACIALSLGFRTAHTYAPGITLACGR